MRKTDSKKGSKGILFSTCNVCYEENEMRNKGGQSARSLGVLRWGLLGDNYLYKIRDADMSDKWSQTTGRSFSGVVNLCCQWDQLEVRAAARVCVSACAPRVLGVQEVLLSLMILALYIFGL